MGAKTGSGEAHKPMAITSIILPQDLWVLGVASGGIEHLPLFLWYNQVWDIVEFARHLLKTISTRVNTAYARDAIIKDIKNIILRILKMLRNIGLLLGNTTLSIGMRYNNIIVSGKMKTPKEMH